MDSISNLSLCTSPLRTAYVFNPTQPEYYLKDEQAQKAAAPATVQVTLSDQAQAALKIIRHGVNSHDISIAAFHH